MLALAGLLAVFLAAGLARVETVLGHPSFRGEPREALLRSDPALLLYITERVLEGGGLPPADFRADPRVQAPEGSDLPAEFTVGEEFLVAWAARLVGPEVPLHIVALWVSTFLSCAAAFGVFLLVAARSRSSVWALLAATLFLVLQANSRTLGFLMMREDLSLPLFALHLGLLARAERGRSARGFLLAGLAAGAAVATWYAMGFVFVLELLCLHLWFLRGRTSPFEVRGAWAVMIGPVLAAALVPALRASGFLLSLPMLLAASLLAVGALRAAGRLVSWSRAVLVTAALLAVALGLLFLLEPGRSSQRHVFDLMLAKARLLGARPTDPSRLSFDTRLLWQGPFQTLSPELLYLWIGTIGWGLALLFVVLATRARRRLGGFEWLLIGLALLSLPAAWAVGRLVVLVGLFLPALAALALDADARRRTFPLVVLLVLVRVGGYRTDLAGWELPWYGTEERRREQADLVRWVGEHTEPSETIAADFVTSTTLLLCNGNPIVVQPKYDSERSRRRIERFLGAFAGSSAPALAELLRNRFRARLLVVDVWLRADLEWTAGLVPGAEAQAVAYRPELLEAAGFESLYRTPRYRVWRVP